MVGMLDEVDNGKCFYFKYVCTPEALDTFVTTGISTPSTTLPFLKVLYPMNTIGIFFYSSGMLWKQQRVSIPINSGVK